MQPRPISKRPSISPLEKKEKVIFKISQSFRCNETPAAGCWHHVMLTFRRSLHMDLRNVGNTINTDKVSSHRATQNRGPMKA